MQSGVVISGVDGALDYELIHDPDSDELTLWIGDLLLGHCPDSAKRHLEHLATPPESPEGVRGVFIPSVADPECGFTAVVDGDWFLLLDHEHYTVGALTDASKVVAFLLDAITGGGLL